MPERSSHVATLTAYFEAVNQDRYDDAAALFASGAELIAPGIEPRYGPEGVAGYIRAALAPYPVHRDEPRRVLVSGDTATVEIRVSAQTPAGVVIEFDAVDIFDFDADGTVVRMSSWYDSHAVRRQLRAARESA